MDVNREAFGFLRLWKEMSLKVDQAALSSMKARKTCSGHQPGPQKLRTKPTPTTLGGS